jgi:hypothetical protein
MDRRSLLGNLAFGTLAWFRAAAAQTPRAVARIGILRLEMTSDMVGPAAWNSGSPEAVASFYAPDGHIVIIIIAVSPG